MDRFFVIITVQAPNTGQLVTWGEIFTESNPKMRFIAAHENVCLRYGLSPATTSVVFYSAEKMPAA